jgi:hypothetical protein
LGTLQAALRVSHKQRGFDSVQGTAGPSDADGMADPFAGGFPWKDIIFDLGPYPLGDFRRISIANVQEEDKEGLTVTAQAIRVADHTLDIFREDFQGGLSVLVPVLRTPGIEGDTEKGKAFLIPEGSPALPFQKMGEECGITGIAVPGPGCLRRLEKVLRRSQVQPSLCDSIHIPASYTVAPYN